MSQCLFVCLFFLLWARLSEIHIDLKPVFSLKSVMRITSLKYLLLDHLGLTLEVFVLLRQDQEAEVRKKDMPG